MRQQTYGTPEPRDVSVEEVDKAVTQQLASLDPQRAQAVAELHKVRIARAESFVREKQRLTLKYGPEDPRLAILDAKIRFNDGLTRDLGFEAVRAGTEVPVVDKNSFVFHGFVRNCAGDPKPGLTVALYDGQGAWIRGMGYGCTDEHGYFKMQGAGLSDAAGAAPVVAKIRVYDKQTLLVTDAKPLPITPGKSEYRLIIVCDDGTCPPPPGDTDEPPPQPVTVPDVVGKTADAAKAELKKAGFTAKSSTRPTGSKQVGYILEQKPEGGDLAARGSEVAIVEGIAEPLVPVPDIVSQTLRDAKTILENAGFVTGKIEPANASEQNKVVKQSPKGGGEAERGAAVDLVIEVPVEKVAIPNVEKLSLGEARKTILAKGLTVGKITPNGAGDEQLVIAQSPKAGTEVERGTAVDLVIEVPVKRVAVPNVEKLTLGEARKTLLAKSLTVGKITPNGAGDEQLVIAQSPKAGAEVEPKAPVDLSIEERKSQVTVPKLKGMKLSEARTALAAVQLTVGKILPPGATDKFIVLSHSPQAETKVDKGTSVDVVTAPALPVPQSSKKSPAKKKPRSKSRRKRTSDSS
jgi:beta-lactam-binding protein with PASTA domain